MGHARAMTRMLMQAAAPHRTKRIDVLVLARVLVERGAGGDRPSSVVPILTSISAGLYAQAHGQPCGFSVIISGARTCRSFRDFDLGNFSLSSILRYC